MSSQSRDVVLEDDPEGERILPEADVPTRPWRVC